MKRAELNTLFAIAEYQAYLEGEQLVAPERHRPRASKLTYGLSRSLRR